jgi:hypothetical protein
MAGGLERLRRMGAVFAHVGRLEGTAVAVENGKQVHLETYPPAFGRIKNSLGPKWLRSRAIRREADADTHLRERKPEEL